VILLSSRRCALALIALACPVAAAAEPSALAASTFRVNSAADKPDTTPGDGFCDATVRGKTPGPIVRTRECTLRAAIQEANALGGAHVIALAPSTYTLSIRVPVDEDASAAGDLDVAGEVTITGIAGSSVIDADGIDRVLDIRPGASVTLTGTTISRGEIFDQGGAGVRVGGNLNLADDLVTGNYAGIASIVSVEQGATLTAVRTAFSGNYGQGSTIENAGGTITLTRVVESSNNLIGTSAFFNRSGAATITDSTLAGNTGQLGDTVENLGTLAIAGTTIAGNVGAGIDNLGELSITNSTIVGNTTDGNGGGLFNSGHATLVNDTFAGNGGGNVVTRRVGATTLTTAINTIFASAASAGNCGDSEAIKSLGHNIDDGNTCALAGPGDKSKTDPLLEALADNGGPTQTRALAPGSPAFDAGDSAACPPTDQRGIHRPTGAGCDIGAFEFAVAADVALTLTSAPAQVPLGQPVTYIAKLANKGPNPATGVVLNAVLPAGAALLSSTPSTGSCTGAVSVRCTLGTLADQATATVTIIATPASAGTARATVTVVAQQVDPDPATNTARAQTLVIAPQVSGSTTGAGAAQGSNGLRAQISSVRARRVHGRVHLAARINVSQAARAKLTLTYRGRTLAVVSRRLAAGTRTLTLVSRRASPAGAYLFAASLIDGKGKVHRLTVRLRLR
jgi:uncharacterized repeat protein (TIGR01451 family)/CSLREA domain-containing protein